MEAHLRYDHLIESQAAATEALEERFQAFEDQTRQIQELSSGLGRLESVIQELTLSKNRQENAIQELTLRMNAQDEVISDQQSTMSQLDENALLYLFE